MGVYSRVIDLGVLTCVFTQLLVVATAMCSGSGSAYLNLFSEENQNPGTEIANIADHLHDLGPALQPPYSVSFFIEPWVHETFDINYGTGLIKSNIKFDRETNDTYIFLIMKGDHPICINITITDINEFAPEFSNSERHLFIPENAPHYKITLGSVKDRDIGENTIAGYKLVSGNTDYAFNISGRSLGPQTLLLELGINGTLDYETSRSYMLGVEVYDGATPSLTSEMKINISVTDTNDNYPIFNLSKYSANVSENARTGTSVCQVAATDQDSGDNGKVTFSIEHSSDPGEHFAIDPVTGVITTHKHLDYETQKQFKLIVKAADGGNQSNPSIAVVEIQVDNVNELPANIDIRFLTQGERPNVPENATAGTYVARISVSDPDAQDIYNADIQVTLQGGDSKFGLTTKDNVAYLVVVNAELDRETKSAYNLTLVAADAGSPPLSASKSFTLHIDDVNDNAPHFDKPQYEAEVDEMSETGSFVLSVTATDADIGDNARITYHIQEDASSNSDWFTVDVNSGLITTRGPVDCEVNSDPSFVLVARDHGVPSQSSSTRVVVSVRDVNDKEPMFEQSLYTASIAESEDVEKCFLKVQATDPDCGVNGQIRYSISELAPVARQFFHVVEGTGWVCVTQKLDHEAQENFEFPVIAKDSGDFETTAHVQITVSDINDNRPLFYPQNYSTNVREHSISGTDVITVQASDEDSGDYGKIVYSIVSGNSDGYFDIDTNTGAVSVYKRLLSGQHLYSLEIDAVDGGGQHSPQMARIHISVTDSSSRPPLFPRAMYRYTISEAATPDTVVGPVQALYDGSPEGITYSISSGDRHGYFSIDDQAGRIRTAKELDHDEHPSILLNIKAKIGNTYATTQVNVTVDDVNDNSPVFSSAYVTTSIPEDIGVLTTIYSVHATDKDSRSNGNGEVRYRLVGNPGSLFQVEPNSGEIHLAPGKELDYEQATQHELAVKAYDLGQTTERSATMTLMVHVQDSNDNPPTFPSPIMTAFVSESEDINGNIFQIQATDRDSGENGRVTFSLGDSPYLSVFGIFPSDGWVFLKDHLDRERITEYTVKVVARDHGQPSLSATAQLTIYIQDENDNYPVFSMSQYSFHILENLKAGTTLGIVQATDGDEGINGKLRYDFLDRQDDFHIHQNGVIVTTRLLDREVKDKYDFEVVVNDSGLRVLSSTVSVHAIVRDTNDNAPTILNSQLVEHVDENKPKGVRVVKIVAEDLDDGENGAVTFSLHNDGDHSALKHFTIDPGNGWITTKEVLDYEVKNTFRFKVIATDNGTPSRLTAMVPFEILVNDDNDEAPIFPQNVSRTFYIVENSAVGTVVGQVQATDRDGGDNGLVSYYIIGGNTFKLFTVDMENGKIYTIRDIDYEESSSHTVAIKAIDNSVYNRKSSVVNINIHVLDVNDNAPTFEFDPIFLKVTENTLINTIIHTFTAKDKDSGTNGTVRYEIFKQLVDKLAVDPISGQLKISDNIDFEEVESISLIIRAYDQAPTIESQLYTTLTVTILVEDQNDNDPVFPNYSPFKVSEDEPVGYQVASIIATDADAKVDGSINNIVSYSITAGNDDAAFRIDQHKGKLTVASPLDRERVNTYSLRIRARDHGFPYRESEVTAVVKVLDINDNVPHFLKSLYRGSVAEASVVGTLVTKVSAEDKDEGVNGQLTYSIFDGIADDYFTIDPVTGLITTATNQLDRETRSSYNITVYVHDAGYPQLFDSVTVIVTIVDINDNAPTFKDSLYVHTIPENMALDNAYMFVAHDADTGDNADVRYSITAGNAGGKFSIVAKTGVLSCGTLDRELVANYELKIAASDGKYTQQCTLMILVSDQNDNDPHFVESKYTKVLFENAAVGTPVDTVSARDPDEGENGQVTYSLHNDTDAGLFDINTNTGVITTKGLFDREKKSSYSFDVLASDGGQYDRRSEKVRVEVMIGDINDNAPIFREVPYQKTVPRGTSADVKVLTVVASDKDTGLNAEVNYRFSEETVTNDFQIDRVTGDIRTKQYLSLATIAYHNLRVVAYDKGTTPLSSTGVVVIIVGSGGGEPDLRFVNQTYTTSLHEHAPVGSRVITVGLVTPLAGTVFSFASGNTDGAFRINSQGLITVQNPDPIDYETAHSMELIVSVEAGEMHAYTSVWVDLLDINDNPPTFTQDRYVTKVYEEQQKETYVMQITAIDADSPGPNSDIKYNIIDGNIDDAFTILPPTKTGIIVTNLIVDYEIRNSYKLTIEAVDNGNITRSSTCVVKILVIDTNDNPPKFPDYPPVNASEAMDVGTAITLVTANDIDISPPITYSFSIDGNPDSTFSIDRFSGMIRLARTLDHERRRSYTLSLEATDSVHTALTTFTIHVTDENDNAPRFTQPSYQVALPELTLPNSKVVQVNATDADAGRNADVTYSLAVAPTNQFYIDPDSGTIYTNNTVQYDSSQEIIQLVVTARDNGDTQMASVAAVHIQITSVNKHAPVFLEPSYATTISEDAERGFTVEHVLATDKDWSGRNKEIDYRILAGNTGSMFTIDQKYGRIILNGELDRETLPEYQLTVSAKDRGIPSRNSTTTVQISVLDVNDNVPDFEIKEYFKELNESFPSNVAFLQVHATDGDIGQYSKLYYTITSGNDEGLFIVDGRTGELHITPNQTLDYEVTKYHKLVIRAIDCTGCGSGDPRLSNICTVHVNVTDINEFSPDFPVDLYLEGVYENRANGSSVFVAHANDKDGGYYGQLQYTVSGTEIFSIHPTLGVVTSDLKYDYETATQRQFRFNVTATDIGGLRTSVPVILNVVDVDEYAPEFEQVTYDFSVKGSAVNGSHIGTVHAMDRDGGDAGRVVYQIKQFNKYFGIGESTGRIHVIHDLNKEIPHAADRKRRNVELLPHHREKRAAAASISSMSLIIEASSALDGSLTASVIVDIEIDRSCPGCEMVFVMDGTDGDMSAAVIIAVIVSTLAVILLAIIVFLLVRRRIRSKDSPPSEAPMYDTDDFDTLPHSHSNSQGPPYADIIRYGVSHTGNTTSSDLSHNSGSSGRGSAEDEEDEELAMINSSSPYLNNSNGFRKTNMPDSGIQDDDNGSEPSVQNHQDYLARLGIDTAKINSKAKSGFTHSVESMHQFSDSGGGEGDGLEIDVVDYTKLADTEVAMLDKHNDMGFHEPDPQMGGSLSNVINSEEEYSGSYNWDYLLDWGPQYQPLAHVFAEIARLKDDTIQPKKPTVQIIPQQRHMNGNIHAQVRTVPPPMITNAPPKPLVQPPSQPSSRSSHSSGESRRNTHASNMNSTRNSTINTSLPSMPRSPISHESSFTSPAITPSFTPSLSPLATRSPSISPVSNGCVVTNPSSGQGTPKGRSMQKYTFNLSEQELRI